MNLKAWLRSKWTIAVVSIVVIYTLTGFLLVPAIIKWQMLKRLPALTHRAVTVQQVRVNPYTLSFTLGGFSLTESNGDPFASLGELYVKFNLLTSIFKRGAAFGVISVKQPSASIVFLAGGTFNFSNLIDTNSPVSEPASAAKPSAKKQVPLVLADQLYIEGGEVSFTDLHRKDVFRQRVGPISFRLSNFTTRPKEGSPYSILATTEDGETFSWSGDVGVNPPRSSGTFTIVGFQIKRYAPYVKDVSQADLSGGQVDFHTDYRFDTSNDTISINVSNAMLKLTGVQVGMGQQRPMKAVIDRLQLVIKNIGLDSTARTLRVGEIRLVTLKSDLTLLPGKSSGPPAQSSSLKTALLSLLSSLAPNRPGGFKMQVDNALVDDASLHFNDESIEPHVTSTIENFNGSVKGLTSDLNTVAAVDMNGKVNGYAPFTISGQVNPLAKDLFVDLSIMFRDIALTPISPYMAKYAGYPLGKGTLSLDLHYYVTQKELKAKNNVRVDQLSLGEASGSPDAVKLPVKLAVALLQDRHGVISLDVPVTGRLDDPKFKLGPIVWQVFMNIIVKAATKPFALLGSMFGGGEDLSFVAFDPGRSDFAVGEINKLDLLATALYERPALHLVITGAIDPAQDREALAKIRLEQQLKTLRMNELAASGQKPPSVDTIRIEPEDRDRLLKLAYAQAVGLIATKGPATSDTTVLSHLTTKQNFEPLREATSVSGATPSEPAAALTVADMEKFLIQNADITPADFQKLMQERADKVQAYLLQTGKAPVDHISVATPKAVDASYQGQSRANLALQ